MLGQWNESGGRLEEKKICVVCLRWGREEGKGTVDVCYRAGWVWGIGSGGEKGEGKVCSSSGVQCLLQGSRQANSLERQSNSRTQGSRVCAVVARDWSGLRRCWEAIRVRSVLNLGWEEEEASKYLFQQEAPVSLHLPSTDISRKLLGSLTYCCPGSCPASLLSLRINNSRSTKVPGG